MRETTVSPVWLALKTSLLRTFCFWTHLSMLEIITIWLLLLSIVGRRAIGILFPPFAFCRLRRLSTVTAASRLTATLFWRQLGNVFVTIVAAGRCRRQIGIAVVVGRMIRRWLTATAVVAVHRHHLRRRRRVVGQRVRVRLDHRNWMTEYHLQWGIEDKEWRY